MSTYEQPITAEPDEHKTTSRPDSKPPSSKMPLTIKAMIGGVVAVGVLLIIGLISRGSGGGDDELIHNINMGLAGTRADIGLVEDRLAAVEGYGERLEDLEAGGTGLRESLADLNGMAKRFESLEQRLDQLASEIDVRMAAFSERLDNDLEEAEAAVEEAERQAQLASDQARRAASAQAEEARVAAREQSSEQSAAPSRPPFSISGVEYRGGRKFLSIASGSVSSLGDVRLLGERESHGEWQLVSIGRTSADFYHRGRSVTVPLP